MLITNLKLPAVEVWRLYRGRANCENQIKELKYDYAVDKMNQNSFDATETTMNFIMIAYNLMSLFKQVVIPAKAKPMLKTIRYTTLNIGSYIVKTGRDKVLKMSLQMKRRKWITQLWSNIENIKQPFIVIDS
ncbi:MAG: transposase [Chitinophagaceae bacterium]